MNFYWWNRKLNFIEIDIIDNRKNWWSVKFEFDFDCISVQLPGDIKVEDSTKTGSSFFFAWPSNAHDFINFEYNVSLRSDRYSSTWYNMPLKVQKMLYIMQIRCRNPCTLTAGGLYEMNMENFGIVCILWAYYKVINPFIYFLL